jgi:hypothetical protein
MPKARAELAAYQEFALPAERIVEADEATCETRAAAGPAEPSVAGRDRPIVKASPSVPIRADRYPAY